MENASDARADLQVDELSVRDGSNDGHDVAPDAQACSTIATCDELMAMVAGSDHYCLVQDVDCAGTGPHKSIGSESARFGGHLDGRGHTVANLALEETRHVALFAALDYGGVVERIGLISPKVRGDNILGTIASLNYGTIRDVFVNGGTVIGPTTSSFAGHGIGGIVGLNRGQIENSYANATVTGRINVGRLFGMNSSTVTSSYYPTGTPRTCSSPCANEADHEVLPDSLADVSFLTAAGWDFDNTWDPNASTPEGFPVLQKKRSNAR